MTSADKEAFIAVVPQRQYWHSASVVGLISPPLLSLMVFPVLTSASTDGLHAFRSCFDATVIVGLSNHQCRAW